MIRKNFGGSLWKNNNTISFLTGVSPAADVHCSAPKAALELAFLMKSIRRNAFCVVHALMYVTKAQLKKEKRHPLNKGAVYSYSPVFNEVSKLPPFQSHDNSSGIPLSRDVTRIPSSDVFCQLGIGVITCIFQSRYDYSYFLFKFPVHTNSSPI